jgi:hypothetical protein
MLSPEVINDSETEEVVPAEEPELDASDEETTMGADQHAEAESKANTSSRVLKRAVLYSAILQTPIPMDIVDSCEVIARYKRRRTSTSYISSLILPVILVEFLLTSLLDPYV